MEKSRVVLIGKVLGGAAGIMVMRRNMIGHGRDGVIGMCDFRNIVTMSLCVTGMRLVKVYNFDTRKESERQLNTCNGGA